MVGLLGHGLYADGWSWVRHTLQAFNLDFSILSNHEEISARHSVVYSFGYDQIIPATHLTVPPRGVIVFHTSDLPEGRGWAPLSYAVLNRNPYLTLTMFYADQGIDTGPLIAKARYPIDTTWSISDLRQLDDALVKCLFSMYVQQSARERLPAAPQQPDAGSFNPRRRPQDSEIPVDKPLSELCDLIRSFPPEHPAFFEYDGARVIIRLEAQSSKTIDSALIETCAAADGLRWAAR